ncbi:hypothetical protein CLV78_12014 [Aliiruegeria haliotis]|uniref:Integrase-like protein n=1 Tax=Aliiruegeria haliotis TaxID=1280846 RepID=A0A2T0REK1_9RHOB|nr:hypothetical protein CLV78_12014 [Aliiruegeria haliotis]
MRSFCTNARNPRRKGESGLSIRAAKPKSEPTIRRTELGRCGQSVNSLRQRSWSIWRAFRTFNLRCTKTAICSSYPVNPAEKRVPCSVGSEGDAYANAMCERSLVQLECSLLDRLALRTKVEARIATSEFIEGWYNPGRRHSAQGSLATDHFWSALWKLESPSPQRSTKPRKPHSDSLPSLSREAYQSARAT